MDAILFGSLCIQKTETEMTGKIINTIDIHTRIIQCHIQAPYLVSFLVFSHRRFIYNFTEDSLQSGSR